MTIPQLIGISLRRWYITLGGLALTAYCAALVVNVPPSYSSRTEVRFVEPAVKDRAALLAEVTGNLTPFVLAVESTVNGNPDVMRLNSRDARYEGLGMKQGVQVYAPNFGNQWATSFPVPSLMVEVVGDTPEEVIGLHRDSLSEIRAVTSEIQQQGGVKKGSQIAAVPEAEAPQVFSVGATKGEKGRAFLAILLVGVTFTVCCAVLVDALVASRGRGS